METTVVTNGHARPLLAYVDLPEAARPQFDYLDTGDSSDRYALRFVKYRGSWYDVHEFESIHRTDSSTPFAFRVAEDSPLASWNGAQTQSVWDAIVMKWALDWAGHVDFDAVVIGHATW